jgi:hypothetical protein
MKIVRHLVTNVSDEERREIEQMGIVIPKMGNVGPRLIAFDLAESDHRWPAVRQWFLNRGDRPGFEHTEFTPAEVVAAPWVTVNPVWHHGYPQPEDDFAYRGVTYDLTDYCHKCGIGGRQVAPFRMTGEPRWGRRSILQLNWVFDEFFVTPGAWAGVFRQFGVAARPVLSRRGAELTTVVQLVNDERLSMTPSPELRGATCGVCGRWKYEPIRRGPLRQLLGNLTGAIARTEDWFGGGHSAFNEVIVSHELGAAITSAGLRGVLLRPIATEPWADPGAQYIDPPADPVIIERWLAHLQGETNASGPRPAE